MAWYISWHDFMCEDLDLKGSELYIYAVIYGFSKSDKPFTGSLKYLSKVTRFTTVQCCNALKSLVNKGYIRKNAINARRIEYTVVPLEELKLDDKNTANASNLTPKCETQSGVSNRITDENKSICEQMDAINDKPPDKEMIEKGEKRLAQTRARLQNKNVITKRTQ